MKNIKNFVLTFTIIALLFLTNTTLKAQNTTSTLNNGLASMLSYQYQYKFPQSVYPFTNYVSSILINGQVVAGNGSLLNIISGPGIAISVDGNNIVISTTDNNKLLDDNKGANPEAPLYIMNNTTQQVGNANFNINGSGILSNLTTDTMSVEIGTLSQLTTGTISCGITVRDGDYAFNDNPISTVIERQKNATITLPPASLGRKITVKFDDINSNDIIQIIGTNGAKIDDNSYIILNGSHRNALTFISDGINWYIIGLF